VAAKAVFHNLSLLLHPIVTERLSRLDIVTVGAGADPAQPIQQVSQLGDESSAEVEQRTPGLILRAVRELMSQDRKVAVAPLGKKDVVAKGHGTVSAELEHDGAEQSGNPARP
jgi:hypothetical protein